MKRKYENGTEIINVKPNAYNFTKIVICRKEKECKNDACVKYLCHVWIKDITTDTPCTFVLKETTIDNIIDNL